jgi:hypothetical protein
MSQPSASSNKRFFDRVLDGIEKVGNKLPDPAVLFLLALALTWVCSWALDGTKVMVPKAGGGIDEQLVTSQLSGKALVAWMTGMVSTFVNFPPLGVVLVAMLGLGVADKSGFINALLKKLLSFTPKALLTPMLILVGLLSLVAVDAGYVLVIPLGGVIFYAAGRHPIAGITASFAAISGGFCANYVPTALDTDPEPASRRRAHASSIRRSPSTPLCNSIFTAAVVGAGARARLVRDRQGRRATPEPTAGRRRSGGHAEDAGVDAGGREGAVVRTRRDAGRPRRAGRSLLAGGFAVPRRGGGNRHVDSAADEGDRAVDPVPVPAARRRLRLPSPAPSRTTATSCRRWRRR